MVPCTVCDVCCLVIQAVDDGASLPSVVLLLPLVHLVDKLQEGALGDGRIAVHGPAQELELLHHPVAVLRLGTQGGQGGQNKHSLASTQRSQSTGGAADRVFKSNTP